MDVIESQHEKQEEEEKEEEKEEKKGRRVVGRKMQFDAFLILFHVHLYHMRVCVYV